ncbi:MAG TPA: hypothetical protein VIY90_17250 [Steroidobacteraceae bacterium]
MKRNIALVTSVGVAFGLLGGCGGADNGPPVSSGSSGPSGPSGTGSTTATRQSLDTEGVLAQAQKSSETSSPYAVDDGLLALTDTSDTSAPVTINANGT